jgi:predicted RNase H-like HicB family nuclease
MSRYPVHVEIGEDGQCFAHVLELPGCISRAETREQALEALPGTIGAYLAWLRRHGELASPLEDPIEIEIVDEAIGVGPFEPDDATARPPDCKPLGDQDMEAYFRLMTHARSDLLALVGDLTAETLDWQAPYLEAMRAPEPRLPRIRSLLRHIGNAEKWYVSRVVPRETLPPEWEGDEELPILEYLSMVRRTAVDRLRQIEGQDRSVVHHLNYWTDHPEEAWKVRKALPRFLEHEFDHTAQIRERLSRYHSSLQARLAAERAGLMEQLLALDEADLTRDPIAGS